MNQPLAGKTVLVTRPRDQAGGMVAAIERFGGRALHFPTIEIAPPETWEECDRALGGLSMYDGLIFTSANGVRYFFQRLKERGAGPHECASKKIFVVGEKTRRAVEEFTPHVVAMPDKFTAADLSRRLEQEDLKGRSFLFPRGSLGKDILADNLRLLGASIDSVTVYRTTEPEQSDIHELKKKFLFREIDIVSFTSPSAFLNFAKLFPPAELAEIFAHAKIAVIGPATREAVEREGFRAEIVAGGSTVESMVEAMAKTFSTASG